MTTKRIYAITDKVNHATHLIVATTQAQALRHVTRMQFDVASASAMMVADKMSQGIKVEDAGEEQQETLP